MISQLKKVAEALSPFRRSMGFFSNPEITVFFIIKLQQYHMNKLLFPTHKNVTLILFWSICM